MPRLHQSLRKAAARRKYWIEEIVTLSGHFGADSERVAREVREEIERDGTPALIDHLRLSGAIPETYAHDSSEEKLYSKFTDILLKESFEAIGFTSGVMESRGDSADVWADCKGFDLVADAKAFRLSRTAKNQKDFKVGAMHGWKGARRYAIVVCPSFQLPTQKSQIYQQSVVNAVSILSYSHMIVIVRYSDVASQASAQKLLLATLNCIKSLEPSKDAERYWTCVNETMTKFDTPLSKLLDEERTFAASALKILKEEALAAISVERAGIDNLSRDAAISALIEDRNIEGREKVIRSTSENEVVLGAQNNDD